MTMIKWHRQTRTNPGDRRFFSERRQFSYAGFIPERRSGKDRRGTPPLFHHGELFPEQPMIEKRSHCR